MLRALRRSKPDWFPQHCVPSNSKTGPIAMRKLLTFLIALTITLSSIGSAFADGSGISNPGAKNVGEF
jgi:hypothetical protein